MWLSVWITAFVALLIGSGNCIPVTEEPGSNSYDERDIVSAGEPSTTEGNGFTLESTVGVQNAMSETEPEQLEIEGSGKCPCSGEADEMQTNGERNIVKESFAEGRGDDNAAAAAADDDDDEDDDDEDDDNDKKKRETLEYALRSLKFLDGKMKRSSDSRDGNVRGFQSSNNEETIPEDPDATREDEEVIEEAEFMEEIYDDQIKMDSPGTESTALRKRRQSGESVPYIKPNLSRRDIPVYPLNMVSIRENTSERGEEKERKSDAEDDNNDEDED